MISGVLRSRAIQHLQYLSVSERSDFHWQCPFSLIFCFCGWTFWHEYTDIIPVTASQRQEIAALQYEWCLLWRFCLLGLYVKYQHKGNTISLTVMKFFILLDSVSGPSLLAVPSSYCSGFCKVSGCAHGDLPCTGGRRVKQPEGSWFSSCLSHLPKVQDVPPRAALPQHTGSLCTGSFLGREGSTADGEWEDMR